MPAYKNLLGQVHDALHNARDELRTHLHGGSSTNTTDIDMQYVDVVMQFIGASGLPKMDVMGEADPYFVAKIGERLTYV